MVVWNVALLENLGLWEKKKKKNHLWLLLTCCDGFESFVVIVLKVCQCGCVGHLVCW